MSRKESGLSPRSQVANRLLQLSELARDEKVAQALRDMEREALSGSAGSQEHVGYRELNLLLEDAGHVLSTQAPDKQIAYLGRLRAQMQVWQRGETERKGSGMSIFDRFSKTKREQARKQKLMEDLERKVFDLEHKYEKLAADISLLDQKREEQVMLATKEPPGSPAYNMAKTRHTQLTAQVKSKRFELQALNKVLDTNQTYLATLREEANIKDVSGYMPVSMETMEIDLALSNEHIETEAEKLRQSAELLDEFREDRNRVYESLGEEAGNSDFDRAVNIRVEGEQVLDTFQQLVNKAAEAEKQGEEQPEKTEEGPGNA